MYWPTANAFVVDVSALYQQEVAAHGEFHFTVYLQNTINYRLSPLIFYQHVQLLIEGQSGGWRFV